MTRGDKIQWLMRYWSQRKETARLVELRRRKCRKTQGNEDLKKALEDSRSREERLYREISEQISGVGNATLRNLLEARYLRCMRWEKVADLMGYCTVQVWRLHRRALDRIRM